MDKVRIGIIGCGGIANSKHLPALSQLPDVELCAFCDIVEERAVKAAAEYGAPGAKVFVDYRKLLELDLDVVHVLTPNKQHSFITVDALESGKHVMCEKPMAINSAEAKKMLDAAKRTGKKLTIGYQNRYRANSWYLKKLCEAGELGEVYYARAQAVRRRAVPTWGVFLDEENQGGGPLIDIGTHALDLTLWCMDNYEVKSVKGSVYKKLGDQKDTGNAWGDWDPEKYTVEDSAFGFITMADGATIILESSWAINMLDAKEARTTLAGTLGGADMNDGLRLNKADLGRLVMTKPALDAAGVDFYDGKGDDPALNEASQWIDAVLYDREPVVKPEQALLVTRILEAIYESAKTGKTIEF